MMVHVKEAGSGLAIKHLLQIWGQVLHSNISQGVAGLPASSSFVSRISSFIPSVSLI